VFYGRQDREVSEPVKRQDRLHRQLTKRRIRFRGAELRGLLLEWDPMALMPEAPDDEYECLLWPLLGMLERNVPVSEIAAYVQKWLLEHWGVDAPRRRALQFAERAKIWFDTKFSGPTPANAP